MAGNVAPYTGLITSEHATKAKFLATVTATVQPLADAIAVLGTMVTAFDLDTAVGVQLDAVGEWVGRSRDLSTPLAGVYFAFDTAGVGFDEGSWLGPYDPTTGMVALPDDAYRTLLRATIAANQWDGTIPTAYAIWDTLFTGTGTTILIQDNQNMSMEWALLGPVPDAVTLALFENGYMNLRPAGVGIANYWTPSVANTPYFGFDVENTSIAGFDTGAWGTTTPGV